MSSSPFARYRGLFSHTEWAAFHQALERPEPRTLRVRRGRVHPDSLVHSLSGQGFALTPVEGLDLVFRVEREPFPLSETLEHWLGLFYIQQAVTTLAAPALDPRPGEGILDLCAAPGGKTSHLAERMEDRGCLVAAELSEPRARALMGNLSRLAHPIGIPVLSDALRLPESAPFHRVLADVPCSGEGRSRREGPVVASEGDLRRLPALQEALLRKALRLVVPGGRVLYVTCTLAPEENEGVVDRVLREAGEGAGSSPPARLLPLSLDLPHAPGLTRFKGVTYLPELAGALRIHPHHLDSGGLFLALLERADGPPLDPSRAPRPLPGWAPLQEAEAMEAATGGLGEVLGRVPGRGSTPVPGEGPEEGLPGDPGKGQGAGSEEVPEAGRMARELHWIRRGRGLRFHRMESTPLAAWEAAGVVPRILTVGLRGFEMDRRGRPLPSGDLLRWMGPELARQGHSLDDASWVRLLDGTLVEAPGEDRQILLVRGGYPLAPGRVRGGRIQHDLPAPRAQWLRKVLARHPSSWNPRAGPVD